MYAFLLLLSAVTVTEGFSYGPGVDTQPDVCESMHPGHGFPPQTGSIPYSLTVAASTSASCYVPEQTVTVTISGLDSTTFRGFLLEARTSSSSLTSGDLDPSSISGGLFSIINNDPDLQILNCFDQKSNAVGHTSNSDKMSKSFQWISTSNFTPSTVHFTATIVQDMANFWLGVDVSISRCPDTSVTPPMTSQAGAMNRTQGTETLGSSSNLSTVATVAMATGITSTNTTSSSPATVTSFSRLAVTTNASYVTSQSNTTSLTSQVKNITGLSWNVTSSTAGGVVVSSAQTTNKPTTTRRASSASRYLLSGGVLSLVTYIRHCI